MSGKYNLESRRQKYLSKSSGTFRKLDQPLALDYQAVTSQSGHSNGKTNTTNQQTNIISQQTKYNERAVDVQFLETTDQDKQTLGIKRSTDNGQTTLAENVASRSKDKNDFKSSETVSTKTSDAYVAESKEIKVALTGGENISPLPHNSKRLDEKLKSDEKKQGGLFERLKRSWKKREDEESLEFGDKKKNKTRQSSSSSSSSEDGDGQRSNGHEMYEIKLPHNDSQNSLELKISDNPETVTEIHSVCYENMTQTVPQPTINVCTDVIPEETEEVAERDSDYINVIDAVSDYYENVDELFPGYDNSFFTDLMPGEFGTTEDDVNFTEIVPDHCENVPTLDAANSVTEHDENTDNQFAESIYDVVEVFDNYQNFVQKDFQIAVPFELREVSHQTRNVSEINATLGESLSRDEPMKYCTTLTIDLTQKTVEGHPGNNEVDHVTSDESSLADGEEYANTMCDSDGSDIIIDAILSNGPHEISTEKNSYPKPHHQINHYSEKRFFLPDSHDLHPTKEKMLIFDNQAVQLSDDKFLVTDEHLVGLNDQKLFVSENQNLHNIDNQITEPDNQEGKWMNQPNTSSKSSSKLSSASNSPDSLRKFLTTFVPASNNSEKLPEQQEWKLFDQVDDERPGIYENVFNQEKKEDQWSECLFQAYSSDEPFVNTSQDSLLDTPVTCVEAAQTSDHFEETHMCPPPPAPEQICVGQVEDGLREQLALIMDRGFSEGWGAVESQKPEDLAPEINAETGRAELLCHVIQDRERGEAVERPNLVPAHQRTQPVECDSIVSTTNNGQGDTNVIYTDPANTCVVAEGDVCEYGEPEISSDISSAQDLENRYVHVKQDGKLIQLLNPRTFLSKIIKFPRKSSPEVKKSKVSKRFVEESVREPEPERKNIEIFTVLYQPCSAEILYIPKVNIGINMDQNTEQHNGATLINEKQHRKETQDKKEILATDEVQKETLAVEEVQKETMALEEVQKETLAVDEVQKETMAVEELQKETMALEEVQKETLAVEEVQKETLAVLNTAKNETIKQSTDVRVKCSQNSTFQETLNDNPPQQPIKNRSLSTSSDDSSSGVEEELIRKDVVSSSHSTHPFHSDAIINLGTDRHVDLPLKEKGTVAESADSNSESADSNSDRCSGETEGRNDKLEMVKVTPLEELTFIVNNQNEVHQLTKPPVDNFISSVASPSESGHTRSQQVSLSSSVRCPPDEQVETTIASNIQKDKETKSGSCVDKQEEEDKTKIEIEMLGQTLHTDSLHHQQLNDSETQETKTVEESSPVIETHHIVITYTGKDKQPKKKSKKTNSPESDQTKKKHFFSWPFRRNKKINEERKSGEGSSSDDDTGETTVELEDVKIENVDFSKEEETTFNEGFSPRTSTPQDISQNTDVGLDHTVDISTKSEQTAESGKSSRRSSVSSSSSVNSITGHIDPSVTLHATPNDSGIVVHEVICVTDKQQQYKSNTDSSDKTTNSSDSATIQTSDTVQTSDNTNTGVADKTLLHKNKHKRNKAPNDISISSKKSGEVEKPFKTTKLKYDKNSSAEPSPSSSSGEDSEEIPRDRTQIHNSQDGQEETGQEETGQEETGQEETQQKVASQTAYTTDGVKSETKPLDTGTSTEKVESASPKSQKASKISKFLHELRSPTKKEPEVNFDNILGSDQRFDGQYHREDDVTHGLPDSQSPSLKSVTQVEYEETSNDPQNVISEPRHFVVVAIDVGTTHSGYAFSFVRDPGSVYMMRRWSGEEPGLVNQKTLTSLLLTPEGNFHSFGYNARSNYLNLIPLEAKHWLYFSTFKMELHHNTELSLDTKLVAANGEKFPAIKVFAYCLEFFKTHALQQLSDQSGTEILNEDIRWVITVPAIWKAPAKQFMREAAYEAGLASGNFPGQLLIALEPEAASIYCRTLRMHQLVPDNPLKRPLQSPGRHNAELNNSDMAVTELTVGSRYLIVDCGGGTVDITVHELYPSGHIKELHRATGGPFGSIGVDSEFEKLLCSIFSAEFIDHYKKKYPMGWVHLMTDFESRKRSTSPVKSTFLNVSLPFTFISDYKKQKTDPDIAVKRYGDPEVDWSQQGMLRLSPVAMRQLFLPTLTHIKQAIGDVLNHPNARDIKYMFLVGGFSESPLLQYEVRHEFSNIMKILIPQEVSLAILKGAVLFGLDPSIVNVRRSRLTYGVGILNKFDPSKHPMSKLVTSSGVEWCTDVFDKYVETDQPVLLGTSVVRRYAPANKGQSSIVLNIYSSLDPNVKFITDPGVSRCGTLSLTLPSINDVDTSQHPREIQAQMSFGDTEISVFAKDVFSGKMVKAAVDFLGT